MIAAQRFKGLGWFVAGVVAALGFYLVSLQVAAERGKLEAIDRSIVQVHRDIRALETEFDTRANLAQLESWNGSVLALTAPTAAQFVASEAAFAQLGAVPQQPRIETAALLVPSGIPSAPAATASDAVAPSATAPDAAPSPEPAAITRAVATVRTAAAPRGKGVGVALLDDKLLSDTTLGELMSRARIETGSAR